MAFKLGDVVLKCQPFAHVVSQELSSIVCDSCFKRSATSFQRCSTCKYVRYCGTRCQRDSWPLHRDECKYLRHVFPQVPTDTVRLIARIVIKMKCGGAREAGDLPDGSKRGFEDLCTHHKSLVHDKKKLEAFNAYFEVLQDCFRTFPMAFRKSEIFEIFGRVLINSFNIMDDEYQPLGIGLYLAASTLDHSCHPNAAAIFNGKELQVRCISVKEIATFADVRISYTNLLHDVERRRRDLWEQYYFRCNCVGCCLESETAKELENMKAGSIQCHNCEDGIPVVGELKVSPCKSCKTYPSNETVKTHQNLCEDVQELVFDNKNGHPEPLEQAEEFYKVMKGLFHPCDKRFLPLLECLSERYLKEEKWSEAYEVCRSLVIGYKKLYPKYDVNTALMLLKLGKLASYLELDSKALQHLEEAKGIILVTHGSNHRLHTEKFTNLMKELKFCTAMNEAT